MMSLHPALTALAAESGPTPSTVGSVTAARELIEAGRTAWAAGPEVAEVVALELPTRAGWIDALRYRVERPAGVVLYVHGGGWVTGSPMAFDAVARFLAVGSGCDVLSIDYRLAPEHPFPAGLEDVEDALCWLAEGADWAARLPIAIVGDSAGANLATVAAADAQDGARPVLQVLFYPVADAGFATSSYREFAAGPMLTAADMRWFFAQYADEAQWGDPRISPLRRDAVGAPAAWIATAEVDVLRDEGELLAAQFVAAGVPTDFRRVSGLPHGFVRMAGTIDIAGSTMADAAAAIARAVSRQISRVSERM